MANFNINKTILGGRLTSDVELKQTTSGISVCSFTLAVNRKLAKDKKQKADFISCVAWRGTAEFISRYFKKGSSLCIVGNIQVRNWQDQNGQERYATEVIVDEAMFVDGKNDNAEISVATEEEPHFEEYSEDDDIPF